METWLTFIAGLLETLAWPTLIAFAIWQLKGPLAKLIPNTEEARFGNWLVLKFFEKLQIASELEEAVEATGANPNPDQAEPKSLKAQRRGSVPAPETRGNRNAVEAILLDWERVEQALRELAREHGLSHDAPTRGVIASLASRLDWPASIQDHLRVLHRLRDDARRLEQSGRDIPHVLVREYRERANFALRRLAQEKAEAST